MTISQVVLIAALFSSVNVAAQSSSIDSGNYYDYYSVRKDGGNGVIFTNWLKRIDVVPVLVEELKAAGYEDVYDNQIYSLPGKQQVVLSVYSLNEDFGFVYSSGHTGIPDKKHRLRRSGSHEASGTDYTQRIYRSKGKFESVFIKSLPANIFMLQEDCYWYQYTNNPYDNTMAVSKETAINILRQDIRARLAQAPKPKHFD